MVSTARIHPSRREGTPARFRGALAGRRLRGAGLELELEADHQPRPDRELSFQRRALTAANERFIPLRRSAYVAEDGRLLRTELLDGFMAYRKANAEWMLQRQPYSEAASQLVLSAWLHRIVNGGAEIEARPAGVAAIDREFAVGSGRVDLLVRWPLPAESGGGVERLAAEVEVRRDKDGDPKDDGLEQLSEYLDRLGLDDGTLVLFDQRSDAPPISERCSRSEEVYGGRRMTVLRL